MSMELILPAMLLVIFNEVFNLVDAAGSRQSSDVDRLGNLLKGYNLNELPETNGPTEVQVGIYIMGFYSIQETTMDYSLSMYVRQQWLDTRLAHKLLPGLPNPFRLLGKGWERIWVPDTYFRNERGATFHDVTVYNRYLTLNTTGYLWYSTKISATLSCPMELRKYPLDTQVCPLSFESFGYTMDQMYFSWLPDPVQIDMQLRMPQFSLQSVTMVDCSRNTTQEGPIPCLEINFVLRRDIGYYLMQIYLPCILIVVLSWVAFWINVDAIPARVTLGLLTVLAMTTQTASLRSGPQVSYIKAMDVWMSMCLIFVFLSLIEFAIVNVVSRREIKNRTAMRRAPPPQVVTGPEESAINTATPSARPLRPWSTVSEERSSMAPAIESFSARSSAIDVDIAARIGFPVAFILFNLLYWTLYSLNIDELL